MQRPREQRKREPWAEPPSEDSYAGKVLQLVRSHPLEGYTSRQLWAHSDLPLDEVRKRLPELYDRGWVRRTRHRPYQYYCTFEEERSMQDVSAP